MDVCICVWGMATCLHTVPVIYLHHINCPSICPSLVSIIVSFISVIAYQESKPFDLRTFYRFPCVKLGCASP